MKIKNADRVANFIYLGGMAGMVGLAIGALTGHGTYSIAPGLILMVSFFLGFGGLAAYFAQEIDDWMIR